MPGDPSAAPLAPAGSAPGPSFGARLVLAGNRPAEVVSFEESVVDFFVRAADLLGVPKSVAAIYGICFANAAPLSLADINDRLDISIGSISQGLRVLSEVGALKVVTGPALPRRGGGMGRDGQRRRDYYEPDIELRQLVSRFIELRLQKQVASGRARLQAILKMIPASSNGSAKLLKGRLKALDSWHAKGRALMPMVKTFLKLT